MAATNLGEAAMRHFHEFLVAIIAIVAIALFLVGFVWRLYRGGPDPGHRR